MNTRKDNIERIAMRQSNQKSVEDQKNPDMPGEPPFQNEYLRKYTREYENIIAQHVATEDHKKIDTSGLVALNTSQLMLLEEEIEIV